MVKIKFPEIGANPAAITDKRVVRKRTYSQERKNLADITDVTPYVSNGIPSPARSDKAIFQSGAKMRVYEYRLKGSDSWLTLIAPGTDLQAANDCLLRRFGERLSAVRKAGKSRAKA